ncbi:MAG: hypothetical protein CL912_32900 [Deltaproteobacteria bacterium]|nr:hypothetical protein [Deltaproteobacteria bacterium]|tara:strand:- start:367 stop:558 length:192 start_codon:yes stop_codon:yes gene_type:complete
MITRLNMLLEVTIVSGAPDFLVALAIGLSTAVVPDSAVPEPLPVPVEEEPPDVVVVFFSSKST